MRRYAWGPARGVGRRGCLRMLAADRIGCGVGPTLLCDAPLLVSGMSRAENILATRTTRGSGPSEGRRRHSTDCKTGSALAQRGLHHDAAGFRGSVRRL